MSSDIQDIFNLDKKKLRFMEASEGTEEFTTTFRNGTLSYLVPVSALFMCIYIGINFLYSSPVAPFAFVFLSACGITIAMSKLGKKRLGLNIFIFSCIALLWALNYPSAERPNGFATGGVYLISLVPIIWWMCFTNRNSRLAILALTVFILCTIAYAGQHEDSSFHVPDAIFVIGLVRIFFIIATTMAIGHTIGLSIKRFDDRWKEGFAKQQA